MAIRARIIRIGNSRGMRIPKHVLEAIAALPADASVEDAMERLYLRHKVLRGMAQADAGQTVSLDETRRRMARWLT
jgi:antitoxin component of MazEF toxin-antitoxin module